MKQFFLFSIILLQVLASCSKSESSPDPEPIEQDPRLIKEYIILDTTKLPPYDSAYKYAFEYDDLKRCKRVRRYVYTPTHGFSNFINQDNTFTGNDTLASSIRIFSLYENKGVRYFFTYDPQRRLISDSAVQIQAGSSNDSMVVVRRYSYPNNTGFYSSRNWIYPSPGSTINYPFRKIIKDGTGNITLDLPENSTQEFSLEFDGHENYLARMFPINAPFMRTNEFVSLNVGFKEQKQYVKKAFFNTYDASGNLITSSLFREYHYTYSPEGLILSVQNIIFGSDTESKYKFIFRY